MKIGVVLVAIFVAPLFAEANSPSLAKAVCYAAALDAPAESVPSGTEKAFCTDVTSEGQAYCLVGALQMENLKPGQEKAFCADVKTRAEGICVSGAVQSDSVKFGQEKGYCAGVNEQQAICLAGALVMEEIANGSEKAYCSEFAVIREADPLRACEEKLRGCSSQGSAPAGGSQAN
jgi:hypothetical protein